MAQQHETSPTTNTQVQAQATPKKRGRPRKNPLKPKKNEYAPPAQPAIMLYLQDIQGVELLDREKTESLGLIVRDGRLAQEQMEQYGDELDQAAKDGLLELCQKGEEAAEELVKHFLPFVVYLAKTHIGHGVPIEDLVQEGNLALIDASKQFDPTKGKFQTYAGKWIKRAMRNFIRDSQWGPVTQSHSVKVTHSRIEETRRELSSLGFEPTNEQVAEATDLEAEQVERIMGIWDGSRCVSISSPAYMGEDTTLELSEQLSQDDDMTMLESVSDRSLRHTLLRVLQEVLDPIEEVCIVLLFGLEDNIPRTYEAIASELNYAKSSVYNICERSKEKLRAANRRCDLKAFLS